MAQLIKLGGYTVKSPTKMDVEEYNLTKAGRVSAGDMTMEFIAAKVKLLPRWDVLSGAEYDVMRAIIRTTTMFFSTTYKDNDITYSIMVYVGAIKRTQFRTHTGAWYWKDVAFDLIEQ